MWLDIALGLLFLAAVVLLSRSRSNAATPELEAIAGGGIDRTGVYRSPINRVVRQAGFRPLTFLPILLIAKVAFAVLLPLGYVELRKAAEPPWLVFGLAVFGFLLPSLWLLARRENRKTQIQRSLSYLLDLIVAFLYSGLSLEEAFRRAGRDGFPEEHPLGEEVRLVSRELDSGRERGSAFLALAERTGVADLRKVAAAMRTGLRLGAPIRKTLEAQADLMRTKRREDGIRRINRAQIQAVFPVVLCGLPIFLVLVFFPGLVDLFDAFGIVQDVVR